MLIAIVALVAVRLAGSEVSSTFSEIGPAPQLRVKTRSESRPANAGPFAFSPQVFAALADISNASRIRRPKGGFMLALWTKVVSWMQEEKGASMVEYALLVVLIAIVALVAVRLAGREVSSTFSEIGSGLT